MNTTDHVFEETKIAGQSRCVAETLTSHRPQAHNDARGKSTEQRHGREFCENPSSATTLACPIGLTPKQSCAI